VKRERINVTLKILRCYIEFSTTHGGPRQQTLLGLNTISIAGLQIIGIINLSFGH
jgi:hypothetical protein